MLKGWSVGSSGFIITDTGGVRATEEWLRFLEVGIFRELRVDQSIEAENESQVVRNGTGLFKISFRAENVKRAS